MHHSFPHFLYSENSFKKKQQKQVGRAIDSSRLYPVKVDFQRRILWSLYKVGCCEMGISPLTEWTVFNERENSGFALRSCFERCTAKKIKTQKRPGGWACGSFVFLNVSATRGGRANPSKTSERSSSYKIQIYCQISAHKTLKKRLQKNQIFFITGYSKPRQSAKFKGMFPQNQRHRGTIFNQAEFASLPF